MDSTSFGPDDTSFVLFIICTLLFALLLIGKASQARPIRLPAGIVPVETPDPMCPTGHRIRDGEKIHFMDSDGDAFEMRLGPCSHCGAHIVRTTRRSKNSGYFRPCSVHWALQTIPEAELERLRKITEDAKRHQRAKRALGIR